MANNIVTINVSVQAAPTPDTLQGSGALVTQGGTNTAADTLTLVSDMAELTAILREPATNSGLAWGTNVATVTTTVAHGLPSGQVIPVTIAGATPTAYNGNFDATVSGTSEFQYTLTPDPGADTLTGTWNTQSAAELETMGNTFFAQGSDVGVYVLELGPDEPAEGITALSSWIDDNPGIIYSYLTPRDWSAESTFATLVGEFTATTAKTYFFPTATTMTYAGFADLKSAFTLVEAPATPSTEFSLAAPFYRTLSYTATALTRVPQTAFAYLYGVTDYPTAGNGSTLTTLTNAHVNYVGTGAEGGISNDILFWGTVMDGTDFTYQYAIDWIQINLDRDLAAAIINGSNSTTNPLYYNQDGINRLQAVAQATLNRAINYGLALGPATVTAIPFATYTAANPTHYAQGIYNGLSATVTAQLGFKSITFNLTIANFVTQ